MLNRILFLLIPLITVNLSAYAQTEKFSATLKMFLAQNQSSDNRFTEVRNGIRYIPMFIELRDTSSVNELKAAGVVFRTITGTIATADVPYTQINKVASMEVVRRLELPLLFERNNDTLMKRYTGAGKAIAGVSPLPKGITGKGVVVGIIDDGIEFGHPDFLDPAGRTTVTAIWSMDYQGQPPVGFNYGTVWEKDTLNFFKANNYEFASPISMHQKFGWSDHGTAVAGLAGGKNGVAPGADLIVVSLRAFLDTLLRSDRIIDGISFIYGRAKAMDKKCVINISLGSQWGGPHDGETLVERAIDEFCKDKPDLIVCTSAGNNGNDWKHWGGVQIRADSSFGIGQILGSEAFYFSIPRQNSSTLRISLTDGLYDKGKPGGWGKDSVVYQTPFLRVDSIVQSPIPLVFMSRSVGGAAAEITFTGAHSNAAYDEIIVKIETFPNDPNDPLHVNKFIFKGSGLVHGYFPFWNLHPLFHRGQGPYTNNPSYLPTDNHYSTVIPTNAKTVLSTGAYNIRDCYINKLQNRVIRMYPSCQLTYFTSLGPTFDGRMKPEIINPGESVLSPRSRWSTFLGHHYTIETDYQMFGGTSASSPITAGMAALLFERFPHYTRDSIVNRLKATAYSDSHTGALFGPVPNNHAGWGKADVFTALTGVSTNYTDSCNKPVICQVYTPPPPPPPPPPIVNFLRIYPNPTAGKLEISYTSVFSFRLAIYDALGRKVSEFDLPAAPASNHRNLQLSHLPAGSYFYKCSGHDINKTGTLIIVR